MEDSGTQVGSPKCQLERLVAWHKRHVYRERFPVSLEKYLSFFYVCDDMAAIKKKSSGSGKRTSGKKRTDGRVSKKKKVGKTSVSTQLKTIVAREIESVLRSGAHNEKRKLTMELTLAETQVFINGKQMFNNCIRIPITAAIPAQASIPDDRRRHSNRIMLKGVNIRMSLSVSDDTRVMIFPYEPHESQWKYLSAVPLSLEPSASLGLVPEMWGTKMVPFDVMGLVSKHGPLMTKKAGDGIALDSVDRTPYECRMSTHGGKPIGSVKKARYGSGLNRTLNWDQGGQAKGVGLGYTAWKVHTLNEYWPLNKVYTYMYEGMTDQVFDRNAEMLLYVDCPSLESREIPEDKPLVGAVIRNVVLDLYYHDM
jgi:hypothetical protein